MLCSIGILISIGWLIAGSCVASGASSTGLMTGVFGVFILILVTWAVYEGACKWMDKSETFLRNLSGL